VRLRNIGANSTLSHFANSIWKSGRPFVILVLMALALFAFSQLLGSIDADGDGFSEVLVMVASTSPTTDLSGSVRRGPGQRTIRYAVALALTAVQPYQFGIGESGFPLHSGRSALQSFCLLRC
jgi:hypothetical protein